jgi:hypothetical protein
MTLKKLYQHLVSTTKKHHASSPLTTADSSKACQSPPDIDSHPLFFIHIPKTAGTSFRVAAQKYFGEEHLFYDYGPKAPETSACVHAHIYGNKDFFGLQSEFARTSCRFFCGHVTLARYAALFSATHLVSFVREPSEQLYSHFMHHVRYGGFTHPFEFFLSPKGENRFQFQLLSGIPIEAVGFIGVTDRYEESLRVFNACYNTDFKVERLNQNPDKNKARYDVPSETLAKFEKPLTADRALYARANTLLNARLHALETKAPYVHGTISKVTPDSLSGFAFYHDQTRPVRVEILVNDTRVAIATAVNNRPGLRAFNVPRNGFVGFDYKPPRPFQIKDRITVCAADTGQKLGETLVPSQ